MTGPSLNKIENLLGLAVIRPKWEKSSFPSLYSWTSWRSLYKKRFRLFIDVHEWVDPPAFLWSVIKIGGGTRYSVGEGVTDSLDKAKSAIRECIRKHL